MCDLRIGKKRQGLASIDALGGVKTLFPEGLVDKHMYKEGFPYLSANKAAICCYINGYGFYALDCTKGPFKISPTEPSILHI